MSLGDLAQEVMHQLKLNDRITDRPHLKMRNATLKVVVRNGQEELECGQAGVGQLYFRNPYNAIQTFLYMGCTTNTYTTTFQMENVHVCAPNGAILYSVPININLKFSAWKGCRTCSRIVSMLRYTLIDRPVKWEDRTLDQGGNGFGWYAHSVENLYQHLNPGESVHNNVLSKGNVLD